ncbi:MAG: tetratricopeptide repeat protein [Gammaproteobacteria bacterium]|nr:tetratricopeptide repeat protein [Gammaproteobacteria bacterium]
MGLIERFEAMLAEGKDSAMLRFGLGNAYLGEQRPEEAAKHLAAALELDPEYSAAWKLYGKALAASGRDDEAREAYRSGIAAAERRGDVQAAREMRVFLRRLERA